MKKVAAAGVLVVVMGLMACGSETTNGSGGGGTMSGSSSSGMGGSGGSSSSGMTSSSSGGAGGSGGAACVTALAGITAKPTCKTICTTDADCCFGVPNCPTGKYPLNPHCEDAGNGIKVCRLPECCNSNDCGANQLCSTVNGVATCISPCSSDAECGAAKCLGKDDNGTQYCNSYLCSAQNCKTTGESCNADNICECSNLLQNCSATKLCVP